MLRLLDVFFLCVCECGQMTSGPAGLFKEYHAIYPGVKLRCSKPHEFILAWDKPGITRDNFIKAIQQG